MKKHNRNTTLNTDSHHNMPLTIRRETVRVLTGDDLAVVAGGSTTIITERTESSC